MRVQFWSRTLPQSEGFILVSWMETKWGAGGHLKAEISWQIYLPQLQKKRLPINKIPEIDLRVKYNCTLECRWMIAEGPFNNFCHIWTLSLSLKQSLSWPMLPPRPSFFGIFLLLRQSLICINNLTMRSFVSPSPRSGRSWRTWKQTQALR